MLAAASPSQTVLSLSYDFHLGTGDNGNVFRIQNNRVPGRSVTFGNGQVDGYDQINRLTMAYTDATSGADCWSFNYGYDAWANLNSASSPQCDANVPPQFKFSVASAANNQFPGYCYDAAGNLINPGVSCVSAYSYDAENRLVSIAGGTYTYDGDGKRVKKDGGATTPTLYWTGTGNDPLAESDLSGRINQEYVFFNGKRIARVEYQYDEQGNVTSATPYYYFSDHLGSAEVITNADGSLIEEESVYYPFGGELAVTLGPNHFKFTGKERDPETGLDYFIARHYTSDKGRFLQPDEFTGGPVDAFSSNDPAPPGPTFYADLTNPQSLNKYAYTYNSPLRFTDPDGHAGEELIGAILGAGAGAAVVLYRTGNAYFNGKGTIPTNREIAKTILTGAAIGATFGAAAHAESSSDEGSDYKQESPGGSGGEHPPNAPTPDATGGETPAPNSPGTVPLSERDPKRFFDKSTKTEKAAKAENRCVKCGQPTVPAQKSQKGVTPPGNEGQTNHKKRWADGGRTVPDNAEHVCRDCNNPKKETQ